MCTVYIIIYIYIYIYVNSCKLNVYTCIYIIIYYIIHSGYVCGVCHVGNVMKCVYKAPPVYWKLKIRSTSSG